MRIKNILSKFNLFAIIAALVSLNDIHEVYRKGAEFIPLDYVISIMACAFFTIIVSYVCSILRKHYIKKYYYTIDNNKKYFDWQNNVLKTFYGNDVLTNVLGNNFPCTFTLIDQNTLLAKENKLEPLCFSGIKMKKDKNTTVLDKKSLVAKQNVSNVFSSFHHKWLRFKYNLYVGSAIRYPDLPGYMLEELTIENKYCVNTSCKIGTYWQNVFSCHILEYELYLAYLKFKNKAETEQIPHNILDYLPYRKVIHKLCDERSQSPLYSGIGRFSLLSVQLVIFYYDNIKEKYCVLLRQRASSNIASKLNYYQFVPCGGFEMYEKAENSYNKKAILDSYSLLDAVYRELLEELFNIETFEGVHDSGENTPIKYVISGHEKISMLRKLISENKAKIELVGITTEMVVLRNCFSYVLRVDDISFFEDFIKKIKYNNEFSCNNGDLGDDWSLDKLQELLHDNIMITPDSAAILGALQHSMIYKEIVNNDFKLMN